MEHLALFPPRFPKQNAAHNLCGFPGGGELVVERRQHGGDLLQAVPVLTAGRQSGQQLDVLEVVETVEDWTQQQFRQIELDSFSEPLTRRLQLVSYFRLSKKRVKFAPGTKQNIKFSLRFFTANFTSTLGLKHLEHISRKRQTPLLLPVPQSMIRWPSPGNIWYFNHLSSFQQILCYLAILGHL